MDHVSGKPQVIKQVNLSAVRGVIKELRTATRAEIAEKTNISTTTVRALLAEMMQNNEIESVGYDESSGGRKAERYCFNLDKYYGAVFCIIDNEIYYSLVNLYGESVDSGSCLLKDQDVESLILELLGKWPESKTIRAIGIGVPGIVEEGGYLTKDKHNHLNKVRLGDTIYQHYQVPIIMENDLNAIMLGTGRGYSRQYTDKKIEDIHMAFLYFSKSSIGAGFFSNGKIIRGWNQYAGELGLMPMGQGKTLDRVLADTSDPKKYADIAARMLAGISCVLNPRYITMGGPEFRKECLGDINNCLNAYLPEDMVPTVLYCEDIRHDYLEGMAYLTAEQIFQDISVTRR